MSTKKRLKVTSVAAGILILVCIGIVLPPITTKAKPGAQRIKTGMNRIPVTLTSSNSPAQASTSPSTPK